MAGETTGEKRLGVGFLRRGVHIADDPLVAGQLNIAAQEDIGHPQQGVEPVDRQQQKAKGLPPVVAAAQMCLLVGDDVLSLPLVHVVGEVDVGAEEAEDKGGVHRLTPPNIVPQREGELHPLTDAEEAHSGVEEHGGAARQPHPAENGENGSLHRVGGVQSVGGGHHIIAALAVGERLTPCGNGVLVQGGVIVDNGHIPYIVVLPFGEKFSLSHILWDKAERTLHGEGQQQPQRHHCPQGAVDGLGRTL